MSRIPAKVPPYDYLSGREFTEKLKKVTGCKTYDLLADHYGIPNSTFSTWHTHNRTGYELIIREHLKSGASVRYLALGEGEAFPEKDEADADVGTGVAAYFLHQGFLESEGVIPMANSLLNTFGLIAENTMVVYERYDRFFIDTKDINPTSGRYLVKFDGVHLLSRVQRKPGNKLELEIGPGTYETNVGDIEVIGRVAATMCKE
ncbi:phage repressor protein CI [Vibrio cionasavignyae]|uniref:phage repressor protein CI n=1 Tax=Vibrio cionasavignyae TaxID=2910252 RepID=UPI003D11DE29